MKAGFCGGLHGPENLLQVFGRIPFHHFFQFFTHITQAVFCILKVLKHFQISFHGFLRKTVLLHLFFHALQTDFVHLVQNNEHLVILLFCKAAVLRHGFQNAAVVHTYGETGKADFSQQRGGSQDQLNLRQIGGIAQDIDIALVELPETALLRPVRPPYRPDLQRFKGLRQFRSVVGIKAGQRNC